VAVAVAVSLSLSASEETSAWPAAGLCQPRGRRWRMALESEISIVTMIIIILLLFDDAIE
jgi:hypothetical protein